MLMYLRTLSLARLCLKIRASFATTGDNTFNQPKRNVFKKRTSRNRTQHEAPSPSLLEKKKKKTLNSNAIVKAYVPYYYNHHFMINHRTMNEFRQEMLRERELAAAERDALKERVADLTAKTTTLLEVGAKQRERARERERGKERCVRRGRE